MAWYFQTSPHDMHDWDSAQTPVLVDGVVNGKKRKLVSTAARNGYFFTLDRVTGEHLVTSQVRHRRPTGCKSIDAKRLAAARSRQGSDRRRVARVADRRRHDQLGAAGLLAGHRPVLRRRSATAISIFYLTDPDPRGSMGLGGKEEVNVGNGGNFLTAIDYKTGKVAWRHTYPGNGGGGGGGLLTTAGRLVFAGDGGGNIVAHDAVTGKPLWHSHIGDVTNAPQTYMLDGRQYLLVATGDTLFAFVLY